MHSNRQILTGDEGIIDSAIRSALLAREFTPRGGSSSLVGDHRETQSILLVMPGLRDHAPGFLWSETLVKAEHRAHCDGDATGRKLLKRLIRQSVHSFLHTDPWRVHSHQSPSVQTRLSNRTRSPLARALRASWSAARRQLV